MNWWKHLHTKKLPSCTISAWKDSQSMVCSFTLRNNTRSRRFRQKRLQYKRRKILKRRKLTKLKIKLLLCSDVINWCRITFLYGRKVCSQESAKLTEAKCIQFTQPGSFTQRKEAFLKSTWLNAGKINKIWVKWQPSKCATLLINTTKPCKISPLMKAASLLVELVCPQAEVPVCANARWTLVKWALVKIRKKVKSMKIKELTHIFFLKVLFNCQDLPQRTEWWDQL
jgi:hypothetical protein